MKVTLNEILILENQVWEALRTGDADLDAESLADSFLGVYPSGFANKQQHCEPLRKGPTVGAYEILTPRLLTINADAVLLCYLAEFSRIKDGIELPREKMYVSSLWQLLAGVWQNTFSQDTPAAPMRL